MEIVLPLEMQANLFRSLPIAGLMVTPDAIAQLVLLNPRLCIMYGPTLFRQWDGLPDRRMERRGHARGPIRLIDSETGRPPI